MTECARLTHWANLTDTEKIVRLRSAVVALMSARHETGMASDCFRAHRHGADGTLLVPPDSIRAYPHPYRYGGFPLTDVEYLGDGFMSAPVSEEREGTHGYYDCRGR